MRPFLQPDTTLPEPRVPDDLEELFCKGSQLKRYVYAEGDYPYIFNDDVCAHTIRCIWTVDVLELPSFLDGDRIRRMFWIHDLPEAIAHEDIGHDMTS